MKLAQLLKKIRRDKISSINYHTHIADSGLRCFRLQMYIKNRKYEIDLPDWLIRVLNDHASHIREEIANKILGESR